MLHSLILSLCGLLTLSSAAVIVPHNRINSSKPPNSNLTIAGANVLLFITNISLAVPDPRFSIHIREGDDDLSDKSTYMNILGALLFLSKYPFTDHFNGLRFSYPGYKDVAITVEPDPHLQINYVMWGLNLGLFHMGQRDFRDLDLHMFWDSGAGPEEVGIIFFEKAAPGQLRLNGNAQIMNSTALGPLKDVTPTSVSLPISSQDSTVLELPSGPAPSPSTLRSSLSSYPISTNTRVNTSAVDIPNAHLHASFELGGARLPKYDLFECICEGIVFLASVPRSEIITDIISFYNHRDTLEVEFHPWNPTAPQGYIFPEDIIYLLGMIPKYMYAENKFQEGIFELEKDGSTM